MDNTRAWWQRYGLLPNTFTAIRILLSVMPAWMIFVHPASYLWLGVAVPWYLAVIIVFIIISLSDVVDGFTARHTNSVTKVGIWLDPLADKLLVIITFTALCMTGMILQPWGWIILVLTAIREIGMIALRAYLSIRHIGVSIPATREGKIKMWIQCIGLGMVLLPVPSIWWLIAAVVVLLASLPYSFISAYAYIRKGIEAIKIARA